MDLGNPIETIVHYLLIRGMIYFGRQDRFFMVSALMCMVTHYIGPTMNHNIRLSIVRIDSSSYYTTLTFNLERILTLC